MMELIAQSTLQHQPPFMCAYDPAHQQLRPHAPTTFSSNAPDKGCAKCGGDAATLVTWDSYATGGVCTEMINPLYCMYTNYIIQI